MDLKVKYRKDFFKENNVKKLTLLIFLAVSMIFSAQLFAGPEAEAAAAVEGVQYGGTLNMTHGRTMHVFSSWDNLDYYWDTPIWTAPYLQKLLAGDIDTYGPRGDGSHNFDMTEAVPYEVLGGELAESWEASTDKLVFNLRQGIMWTGNEYAGVAPREFVAEDVVFNIRRFMNSAIGAEAIWYVQDVRAADKYTVVIDLKEFSWGWVKELGWGDRAGMYAPETIEAGVHDWRNHFGTGAFKLTDFVQDSYFTYEKNANYWKTATVDGVEYDLPFVEKVQWPIIRDFGTLVSALRTGRVDMSLKLPLVYEESLARTSPQLNKYKFLSGAVLPLWLQCDGRNEALANRDIRRALSKGTDRDAIIEAIMMEGYDHTFPINPNLGGYTPKHELPAEVRTLFDYDPDYAKSVILEHYPNGLDLELISTLARAQYDDYSSMVVDQWSRIGVNLRVRNLEAAPYLHIRATRDFPGAYFRGTGNTMFPLHYASGKTGMSQNMSGYSNPEFDRLYTAAETSPDVGDFNRYMTEAMNIYLGDAAAISLGSPMQLNYWWPWVKNYYGEHETGYLYYTPIMERIWIDPVVKRQMGR